MRDKTKDTYIAGYGRRPRTSQERRENGKRSSKYHGWGRAKRNQANLVNAWDDRPISIQKTWKVKRRHQYRENKRGKPHTLFLPNSPTGATWRFWINIWALKEYFNNHDVPFCIEDKWDKKARTYTHEYVYVQDKCETITVAEIAKRSKTGIKKIIKHQQWQYTGHWILVPLKKPKTTYFSKLLGYQLTWWGDKDIGIEHILQTHVHPRNIG